MRYPALNRGNALKPPGLGDFRLTLAPTVSEHIRARLSAGCWVKVIGKTLETVTSFVFPQAPSLGAGFLTPLMAFISISFFFYSCSGWPVESYREIRFRRLMGQSSVVNCGPASLGTILDRFFGIPTTQKELVNLILGYIEERTDEQGRDEPGGEGVSMLDLKRASGAKGVLARGYRLPQDKLLSLLHNLKLPLLLHFERPDDHFVVALGGEERAKMIIIADPSWGIKIIHLYELEKRWDGLLLAFAPSERSARKARSEINDVVRVTGNKLSNLWFAGRASWNMFQGE